MKQPQNLSIMGKVSLNGYRRVHNLSQAHQPYNDFRVVELLSNDKNVLEWVTQGRRLPCCDCAFSRELLSRDCRFTRGRRFDIEPWEKTRISIVVFRYSTAIGISLNPYLLIKMTAQIWYHMWKHVRFTGSALLRCCGESKSLSSWGNWDVLWK